MEKETMTTFTEEDKRLLATPLPDDPRETRCSESERHACYGCPDGHTYEKAVEPYGENGIYEIALALRHRGKRKESLDKNARKLERLTNGIPDFLKEPT